MTDQNPAHAPIHTDSPVAVAMDPADATLSASSSAPKRMDTGRQASLTSDAWRELRTNPLFIVSALFALLMIVIAIAPQFFFHTQPTKGACDLADSLKPPRSGHLFGNDRLGCDVLGSVIWGARPSIFIGLSVTFFASTLAVLVGSVAGFYGGLIDAVLSRLTDVALGFPFLVGAIVLLSAFPSRSAATVALVLVIFGWSGLTRIMRGSVIAAKDMDYVTAARALGASNGRMLWRHVLPNAITPIMVLATIGVGGIIGSEATLTFLGVGLQVPNNSWGLSISGAQQVWKNAPHTLLFPSIVLSLTVLAFIVLGDTVRDAFDPKLR
jgi:oligopeptide transport system permease protein